MLKPKHAIDRTRTVTLILVLIGALACYVLYSRSSQFNPSVPDDARGIETDKLAESTIVLVAVILALIPATRRVLFNLLLKLKNPSRASVHLIAAAILVLSGPFLYSLAILRGQILLPQWHDENMYRLQTTMLAHGKLCMPALPLPDFFDAPYILTRPVYAAMYFPGTALLHVPGVWFHLPYCAIPLAIAAITLALLYLVVTELVDGVAGLLAVLLMVSLELFRWMSVAEMSHAAGAMWGLAAMFAWLRWRKTPKLRWVVLAGLSAGWYAITRPFDAVCVLLPISLAWAWELRTAPMKARFISLAIVVAMIAPFIALQLAFDRTVTGNLLQTPVSMYYRTYMNLRGVGLEKYDPRFVPPTPSKLMVDAYQWFVVPRVQKYQTIRQAAVQFAAYRIPLAFGVALPTMLLVMLYPVGLLRITDIRRGVMWSIFWFYLAGSALFFQFFHHYAMALAPALIFSVLLGAQAISRACSGWRAVEIFLTAAIFALAVHRICAVTNFFVERRGLALQRANYVLIPSQVKKPAIVLFRYASDEPDNILAEPVYNWDVASPDEAPIIRAHDLGPARDRELFDYYAGIQPDRNVYLFDRKNGTLEELGNVAELAKNSSP